MSQRPSELPAGAKPYRTIGPFDRETLPKGLLAEHRLKPGTWGQLELFEGTLQFTWDDAEGGVERIEAPAQFVVPPEVPHHVAAEGPFKLTITFLSA